MDERLNDEVQTHRRAITHLHPDAELHQPPELPAVGSYIGLAEFERGINLWTFKGGKAQRCEVYFNRPDALEAAGLQE